MLALSFLFISFWSTNLQNLAEIYTSKFRLIPVGIESIAMAFSVASIFNLTILLVLLNRKIHIFSLGSFWLPQIKIFSSVILMGFAIYIPIKLLDQLVFDTTRTINLIFLTAVASLIGLSIYLFLTWLLNVKEASTFLLIFKRLGNWKELVGKSERIIETRLSQ